MTAEQEVRILIEEMEREGKALDGHLVVATWMSWAFDGLPIGRTIDRRLDPLIARPVGEFMVSLNQVGANGKMLPGHVFLSAFGARPKAIEKFHEFANRCAYLMPNHVFDAVADCLPEESTSPVARWMALLFKARSEPKTVLVATNPDRFESLSQLKGDVGPWSQSLAALHQIETDQTKPPKPKTQVAPEPRLVVDIEKRLAVLDGKQFELATENVARWLRVLAKNEGQLIKQKEVAAHDAELKDVRVRDLKAKLPAAIKRLVETKSTAAGGTRLRLPVLKK